MPLRLAILFVLCGLAATSVRAATRDTVQQPHLRATLLAEHDAIQPGRSFTLGLLLEPDEHWHTYWRNPGESGMATRLQLSLPEGFIAGELQWPTPTRFVTDGPIVNFGYEGTVLLLIEITPPPPEANPSPSPEVIHSPPVNPPSVPSASSHADGLASPSSVTIAAAASWLVCDPGSCVPGKASWTLTLPVTGEEPIADADLAPRFAQTRAAMPQPIDVERVAVRHEGTTVTLTADIPEKSAESGWMFFPADGQAFETVTQTRLTQDGRVEIRMVVFDPAKPPPNIQGVLKTPTRSYGMDVPWDPNHR